MQVKICKSCIMISTRLRITYNKDGLCTYVVERRKKINWKIRKKFKDIIKWGLNQKK